MSSSLAEFSVRVCEEADLPEICGDISEGVYFGHDYLRLLLPRWFRAQQTKVEVEGVQLSKYELFVIEHLPNRRVVAFEAIAFLDNFATVTFRGLRVHRDWNGRGLSKLLKHHLEARVASLPFVRRLRVTTGSYNTTSMKIHQGTCCVDALLREISRSPFFMRCRSVHSDALAHLRLRYRKAPWWCVAASPLGRLGSRQRAS
eukprot:m.398334 g.398334  ORF g.398334 m.398334 type:complete len:202 (+) comp56428_c0_seq3:4032-4637(+)